jgi:hypothetical protein
MVSGVTTKVCINASMSDAGALRRRWADWWALAKREGVA